MSRANLVSAVVAVSADGYMAREAHDRMYWLGVNDKAVFRLLTAEYDLLGAGQTTLSCMPNTLDGGRYLVTISRSLEPSPIEDPLDRDGLLVCRLEQFAEIQARKLARCCLIGGPSLLSAALSKGYIGTLHVCWSSRYAFPLKEAGLSAPFIKRYGRLNTVPPHDPQLGSRDILEKTFGLAPAMQTKLGDVTVMTYRSKE